MSDFLPCLPGSQRLLADASDYFKRVVLPHSHRSRQQWTPIVVAVTELETLLTNSQTPAYRQWRRTLDKLWQALNKAPASHLQGLTQAQQGCQHMG